MSAAVTFKFTTELLQQHLLGLHKEQTTTQVIISKKNCINPNTEE